MALPVIAAGALASAIGFVMSRLVTKLLFALGVGVISFAGGTLIVGRVESYLASLLGGMDSMIVQAWTVLGMPTALSIAFAAITTRITIMGASKIVAGRTAS